MKPITGRLKWRLQERARADVFSPKPIYCNTTETLKRVAKENNFVIDPEIIKAHPENFISIDELSPTMQIEFGHFREPEVTFIPPRPQPAWRHVTQRRNQ